MCKLFCKEFDSEVLILNWNDLSHDILPSNITANTSIKSLNIHTDCHPKVLEQNKIFSHNFKKYVLLNMFFTNNMDRRSGPTKCWA